MDDIEKPNLLVLDNMNDRKALWKGNFTLKNWHVLITSRNISQTIPLKRLQFLDIDNATEVILKSLSESQTIPRATF